MDNGRSGKLIPNDEVWRRLLTEDPEYRVVHEEGKLAGEVSLAILIYRTRRGLSQRALAEILGMRQPQVARLEAGDVTPSWDTLMRLSKVLGLRIRIDISPDDPNPEYAPIDSAFTTVTIKQPKKSHRPT